MKPVALLGLLVVTGALGAVAGGVVGTLAERRDEGPDAALLARLDEVTRAVDALRASAAELRDGVADVRERVVAVELEMSRRAAGPMPLVDASGDDDLATAATDPAAVRAALNRRTVELERRLADAEAATLATKERFTKGLKIRAMPEDERWQYTADTLRLNSVQVDEIRAAHTELQEGLKAAIVEETNETAAGTMTFRRVDGNRLREAQEAFQARVDNALNEEQKEAWNEEGFSQAFGRSRNALWVSAPRRVRETGGGEEPAGTATIEIVTGD